MIYDSLDDSSSGAMSKEMQTIITAAPAPAPLPPVVKEDPYLAMYTHQILGRYVRARAVEDMVSATHGSLVGFAASYRTMGFCAPPPNEPTARWVYREYAPGAASVHLIGDCNGWSRSATPLERSATRAGVWEVTLKAPPPAASRYKVAIATPDGRTFDRISPWARRVVPESNLYCSVFHASDYAHDHVADDGRLALINATGPQQHEEASAADVRERVPGPDYGSNDCEPYAFLNPLPVRPKSLRIYECHVGISSDEPRIASYRQFTANVLPRIKALGYNAIQLMAVQEHAYYACFGYQVTSFFAPSGRFGTPNDLRHLVDSAHAHGLIVFLDLVHSHACKNTLDGLNDFDGTDHCFFHGGSRGTHSLWDSRLFNYGSVETLRFLLGNCLYWLRSFNFDGFRFDGVTSMLYRHHGVGYGFSGHYEEYFGDDGGSLDLLPPGHCFVDYAAEFVAPDSAVRSKILPAADKSAKGAKGHGAAGALVSKQVAKAAEPGHFCCRQYGELVDSDAVMYLTLANKMIHSIGCVTIAEDVSGMPTLARPVALGGIGFDYRLGMAAPDLWIKMLKEQPDENWSMGTIVHTLMNHRYLEPVVAYAESHDQALVGDKTIAFWLMDAEMYSNMSEHTELTPRIARGLALHKMIRLLTMALGGNSYLNFIGNEFGHPEWLDFPREGNGNSYHYARRQWRLVDDKNLRYRHLNAFDSAMLSLDAKLGILASYPMRYVSLKHEDDKVIVFELTASRCVCVFNFNSTRSFPDYRIGVPLAGGSYRIIFDSDSSEFGGFNHVDRTMSYVPQNYGLHGRPYSLMVYLPCRSAQVYRFFDDGAPDLEV